MEIHRILDDHLYPRGAFPQVSHTSSIVEIPIIYPEFVEGTYQENEPMTNETTAASDALEEEPVFYSKYELMLSVFPGIEELDNEEYQDDMDFIESFFE